MMIDLPPFTLLLLLMLALTAWLLAPAVTSATDADIGGVERDGDPPGVDQPDWSRG